MMEMNLNPMTLEQINYIMNQNPTIKPMIYSCIQDPISLNQVLNILNVLNCNPFLMNQMRMQMNQEMMNMMMNMNMDMNQGKEVNIWFRKNSYESEKPIIISARMKDKVSQIIEKYRKESNDYDEEIKFIFNAKVLHPSLTLEEAGLNENANVFVVVTKGVKGG